MLKTYKSLCQHMYEKHKSELKKDNEIDTQASNDMAEQDAMAEQDETEVNTGTSNCSDSSPSFSCESQLITREAAKLKTLEGKKLTQTVADDIIADTNIFVESALDHLKQKLEDKLGDNFEEIEAILSDPEICNPFRGLEIKYQQEHFFQQHFNYVVRVKLY